MKEGKGKGNGKEGNFGILIGKPLDLGAGSLGLNVLGIGLVVHLGTGNSM
jgi:hypothetical protein